MRPAFSSRTNSRPERVAPDEALVLVSWSTLMVSPSVSQLRLNSTRRRAGFGNSQAQGMPHFLFFRLQVGERMRRRPDLAGNPFDDLDAGGAERAHLAWIIGQQPNARDAKVVKDRGRQAEIPEVRLEPERMISLDRVDAHVLQLVGFQLCHQANAASFLMLVEHEPATFFGDSLHRHFQLIATIAAQ